MPHPSNICLAVFKSGVDVQLVPSYEKVAAAILPGGFPPAISPAVNVPREACVAITDGVLVTSDQLEPSYSSTVA